MILMIHHFLFGTLLLYLLLSDLHLNILVSRLGVAVLEGEGL